jgi:hypothetical protein
MMVKTYRSVADKGIDADAPGLDHRRTINEDPCWITTFSSAVCMILLVDFLAAHHHYFMNATLGLDWITDVGGTHYLRCRWQDAQRRGKKDRIQLHACEGLFLGSE